jgi:LPXTG-motif cell wall-anchored protein
MTKINKSALIIALVATFVVTALSIKTAYAECRQNYGGGETCFVTNKFKIRKFVRLEGDNNWKDEITIDLNDDDENDKKIEFKVEVTAEIDNPDNVDLDDVLFDDMKMKDKLPEELKFLDESEDDLTEEWDDFEAGETKTFYFTVKIKDDEKDQDEEFEKCVVNKASLYYQDEFQGSDEAVVCYKKTEDVLGVTTSELPKTGALPLEGLAGLALISLGSYLSLKNRKLNAN